jgi:hypothetical protein
MCKTDIVIAEHVGQRNKCTVYTYICNHTFTILFEGLENNAFLKNDLICSVEWYVAGKYKVKICFVHINGVKLCLWNAGTNRPTAHPSVDVKRVWRATAEWYWQGKTGRTQRKTCPSATLSTTHSTWTDTRANPASMVRGQRLTTSAMAWPWYIHNLLTYQNWEKECSKTMGSELRRKSFWGGEG